MDDVVERFARWLWSNSPKVLDELAPGLSDDAIAGFEKQLGVTLPDSLRALYRWRNGNAAEGYGSVIGRWRLTPLERVVSTRAILDGLLDDGTFEGQPSWWRKSWVPFTDDMGGNGLCWDTRGTLGGVKGQVLEFWHDSPDRKVLAPNVDDWLVAYVDSLEAGLWRWDPDYGFEELGDFAAFLGKRFKGYPYRAVDFDGNRGPKPPPPPVKVEADPARPVKLYAVSARFAIADQIQHPKFGTGVVQTSDDTKIEVEFASGRHTLVHARGASGGLAKPPKIDHSKTPPKF